MEANSDTIALSLNIFCFPDVIVMLFYFSLDSVSIIVPISNLMFCLFPFRRLTGQSLFKSSNEMMQESSSLSSSSVTSMAATSAAAAAAAVVGTASGVTAAAAKVQSYR